jgi:hypothetical protein
MLTIFLDISSVAWQDRVEHIATCMVGVLVDAAKLLLE